MPCSFLCPLIGPRSSPRLQFFTEVLIGYLPIPPFFLRVFRVIRILRILRLLKGAKELRDLIVTMILSLPSLANVSSLLALIVFIYAVLGRQVFAFPKHQELIDALMTP